MTNQHPVQTIRDGLISASIWQNQSQEGGKLYSVTFSRGYLKDDALQNASSFSRSEILRVSRLADQAYDWITSQMRRDRGDGGRSNAA